MLDIAPTDLETAAIKWLTDNHKIGELFAGKLILDSDDAEDAEFFKGTWLKGNPHELDLDPIDKVIEEYQNGSDSTKEFNKGQAKSLSQKYQERILVASKLAWLIMYPDVALSDGAPLERIAIETIGEMSKEQLAVFDRLMPLS